jgi:hypothetical protein
VPPTRRRCPHTTPVQPTCQQAIITLRNAEAAADDDDDDDDDDGASSDRAGSGAGSSGGHYGGRRFGAHRLGGAIGAVAALVLLSACICCCCSRFHKRRAERRMAAAMAGAGIAPATIVHGYALPGRGGVTGDHPIDPPHHPLIPQAPAAPSGYAAVMQISCCGISEIIRDLGP